MENNSHRLLRGVFPHVPLGGGSNTLLPLILAEVVPSNSSSSCLESHHGKSFLSLCPILINAVRSPDYLLWAAVCVSVCVCECVECGQKTSGSVTLRSSHCWERVCVQSLTLGTWLSSSLALSRHWLLLTWIRVSFTGSYSQSWLPLR